MERIPILRMGRYLLVTIQVDMHDQLAMTLQDDLTQRIVSDNSQTVQGTVRCASRERLPNGMTIGASGS